jgi:outer membrane protein
MRSRLLPLFLAAGMLCTTVQAEDLVDAFRKAVANDPVLATANANRLAVAEGVPQARSALLPQLSVGLDFDQFHGGQGGSTTDSNGNIVPISGGGHERSRDFDAQLTQPILNLQSIATLRAAQSTRDSQNETDRAALENLYVRVTGAYFNVLVAQDQLEVDKSYEDAYKQEFEQSGERFKQGLVAESDVNQSQAYYQFIKAQRITAMDALKDARRALEQITGEQTGELKVLREDLPMQAPTPNDAKAWVDAAMQTNPTILAAHYAVKADEHRISAARAGHLPTLSLGVDYSKFGNWSNTLPGSAGYGTGTTTLGLTLTVPIFTGGLTQSQVRQAIALRDADEGTLETQRRQAARDANNFFTQIVDGVEQVQSARTSVEAAKRSLASMRAGNDIGTQSLTNVVIAIQVLAEAQSEYTVVRHQFILNKLLLKQAAGTIVLADLEDVNRLLE